VATAERHREWAASNEALYHALDRSKWPDWAVTIIFYAVLHEVSAFLKDEIDYVPGSHKEMKKTLTRRSEWDRLLQFYEGAQDDSNKTRYRCYMPREMEVDLAAARLHGVRAEIEEL
jgi:hypothetical protein